jgi:hypothetical protein
MRCEIGRGKEASEEERRVRDLERAEMLAASHCKLVLTIAAHENAQLRQKLGLPYVELLPMSWPDEKVVSRTRPWLDEGVLRLLHLGTVDAFVTYYSLKFLLGEVFPRLPKTVLNNLELLVVGKIKDTPCSREIREMSRQYPQVRFLGYVDDVHPFYAKSDLQVVGATRATGLRTRIIESFVYGLPVLSTWASAPGVVKLSP